jgi:hypothetical protein
MYCDKPFTLQICALLALAAMESDAFLLPNQLLYFALA